MHRSFSFSVALGSAVSCTFLALVFVFFFFSHFAKGSTTPIVGEVLDSTTLFNSEALTPLQPTSPFYFDCLQHGPLAQSSRLKRSEWAPPMLRFSNDSAQYVNQFVDINGDALPDHVLIQHIMTSTYPLVAECVHMNNGKGWDLVYVCANVYDGATQKHTFYGDCADLSSGQ